MIVLETKKQKEQLNSHRRQLMKMSKLILLKKFDLTPKNKIVKCAKIGEEGYAENVEYEMMSKTLENGDIAIWWYGEDDTEISIEEYVKLNK